MTQFKIHDTQLFEEYREFGAGYQRKPRLATLASAVLGRNIQVGEHSSVEDAQATMDLFLRRREGFEANGEARIWTAESIAIPDTVEDIMAGNAWSSINEDDLAEEAGDSPIAVIASVRSKVVNDWSLADVVARKVAPEITEPVEEITAATNNTRIDTLMEEIVDAEGRAVIAQEKVVTEKKIIVMRAPASRVAVPAWEDIKRARDRRMLLVEVEH